MTTLNIGGLQARPTCGAFLVVMTKVNEALLDELLGKLESARARSPRVISKLETLIRSGDDYSLFRVNPIQFATEKS